LIYKNTAKWNPRFSKPWPDSEII